MFFQKLVSILRVWKFFFKLNWQIIRGSCDPKIFADILKVYWKNKDISGWKKDVTIGQFNPDWSLEEAIKFCHFQLVDPEINENIDWKKENLYIKSLDKPINIFTCPNLFPMTTKIMRQHLSEQGDSCANFYILLICVYIEQQRQDQPPRFYVALGTSWQDKDGNTVFPCVSVKDGRWVLFGKKANDNTFWPAGTEFVAFRKEK